MTVENVAGTFVPRSIQDQIETFEDAVEDVEQAVDRVCGALDDTMQNGGLRALVGDDAWFLQEDADAAVDDGPVGGD